MLTPVAPTSSRSRSIACRSATAITTIHSAIGDVPDPERHEAVPRERAAQRQAGEAGGHERRSR